MKTLILKEWRERRVLFLAVTVPGLIVIIHSVFNRFSDLIVERRISSLIISYYVFPAVFALFLGALSFNRRFINSTRALLTKSPDNAGKMFWIRFFSGLIVLLIPVLFSHAIFRIPFQDIMMVRWQSVYVVFSVFLLFPAACFSSILFKNRLLSILCSPLVLASGILLLLPLLVVYFLVSPHGLIWVFFFVFSMTGVFLTLSFVIWQKVITKNVLPLKKIAIAAVSILAFSLTAHAFANLAAGYRLGRTMRHARNEGLLLTREEVTPPAVPDEDNAALLFQEAFDLAERLEAKYEAEWQYIPFMSRITAEEMTGAQIKVVAEIMNSPEFAEIYSLIEQAVSMPACRFDIQYEKIFHVPLPHLARLRNLARLTAARTFILAEGGRYAEALESAKTSLRIADVLEDEPFLISHHIRLRMDSMALKSLNLLLDYPGVITDVTLKDYDEIISIIEEKDASFTKGLKGELAYKSNFSRLPNIFWEYTRTSRRFSKLYDSYLCRPVLKEDNRFYIRAYSELVNFSKESYVEIKEKAEEWDVKVYPASGSQETLNHAKRILSTIGLFGHPQYFSMHLTYQARYKAFLDKCRLGLALEVYREKHGYYPGSLEALKPEILQSLPPDPFTGEDYIYRREDEGFMVYSVGPSGRDDGGIYDMRKGYDDIVWEINRKAPEDRANRGPVPGMNWISPSTGMEFVWIEPMEMWVGKYEVTNEEYREINRRHDSRQYRGYSLDMDRQPAVDAILGSVISYARRLTERDWKVLPPGYIYRLPSPDEWLMFAQCGDGRKYPWGDEWPPPSGHAGNYADETAGNQFRWEDYIPGYYDGHAVTAPVDELWENPWGLYGVGGNVWEFCIEDENDETSVVMLGASWRDSSRDKLQCSYRPETSHGRGYRRVSVAGGSNIGFRLVLSK